MIRILLDASSDCMPNDSVCDYFIPIAINFEGKEYLAGTELDVDSYYTMLTGSRSFPRTSQPSPQSFIDVFEKVKADGDELIYFAPSSPLSGTYQCACLAKDMVGYEGIHIVDSRAATHIIGLLARAAKKLIEKGERVEEILKRCEDLRSRIRVIAGVDTLEYLHKSGRMNRMFTVVGELSRLKPVITFTDEGYAEPLAKCLGRSRAMQNIINRVKESRRDEEYPMQTLYTCGEENVEKLEKKLGDIGVKVAKRLQIGSTIGSFLGPGVFGVLYVAEQV